MGYEQLVPPICYYLCLSRTFLSNYNRYRNERDSFTQLIDLKISSRTVCVILERKHKEIPEILHIHYVQNRFITAHTQLFFHSELCHIYTTKLYATSLHDSWLFVWNTNMQHFKDFNNQVSYIHSYHDAQLYIKLTNIIAFFNWYQWH